VAPVAPLAENSEKVKNGEAKEVIAKNDGATSKKNIKATLAAASASSLLLTTLLFPMDLCHTRMATDMSKKPSLYTNKNISQQQKQASQFAENTKKERKPRLYSNISDCLKQSRI